MAKEISRLIAGYQKFYKEHYQAPNEEYLELIRSGQRPKTLIIGCCDSRVDPALILDTAPGDLFVVRNVANLVPPCEDDSGHHGTTAAIEYAVCVLNIRHLVIMGHSQCGGIRFLVEHGRQISEETHFINKWMELLHPVKEDILERYSELPLEEQVDICSKYALKQSLKNLQTFSWIQQRVHKQELYLHGWFYNMMQGKMEAYNSDKNDFSQLI